MANHLFERVVARGRAEAAFLAEHPGGRVWSYRDLRRRAAAVAGALQVRGVKSGDRVAARVAKSAEGLMLYLGVVAAGAVFLPLNPAYTMAELAFFLGDAEPALVVCAPDEADAIRGLGMADVLTLDADRHGSLAAAADDAEAIKPVARSAGDIAAILYTSGTTRRSKGAMIAHGNLVSNADALAGIWRFTAADRLLYALQIYHTHGLFTALNTVLAAGASLLFLPRFDPDAVLAAMPRATTMMGVPTFYTRLLDHPGLAREATAGIRLFVSGSASLLDATRYKLRKRLVADAELPRNSMGKVQKAFLHERFRHIFDEAP